MAEQQIELAVSGLQTDPGPFSAAPGGALIEAQNVAFRRPGVIEPRGPFTYTLDSVETTQKPISIFEWNGNVYTILDNNVIRKNGSSTIATDATGYTKGATWSAIANDRVIYTTDSGAYSIYTSADTVSLRSGTPRANGFFTKLVASGTAGLNWLPNNYATAYRLVNARFPLTTEMLGPPTDLRIVRNNSGAAAYVTLRCYVDAFSGLVAGDQIHIYRALKVTPYSGAIADELRLRTTLTITSGDLSTGYIDYNDQLDDTAWSGASLYTNESQDGLALSNYRPYFANDVAFYNNMMFYGQYTSPHRVSLNVVSMGGTAPSDLSQRLSIENVGPVTFALGAGTITAPAAYRTGGSAQGAIQVGQVLTATGGTPESADAVFAANTTVTAYNPTTGVITLSAVTLSGLAGGNIFVWDWISVQDAHTSRKIYAGDTGDVTKTKVFATAEDATNGLAAGAPDVERCWAASYSSSDFRLYADETGQGPFLGVQLTFERISINFPGETNFTVKSTKPLAFDKYCDTVTGVASTTDGGTNNIAWSKYQLPEAVPLPYFKALGPKDNVIQRLAVLKDTLFIFTTHGMYRFFGTDPDSLIIDLFDPTIRLVDPRMLARSHNVLWAWTTRGVMRISAGGTDRIDLPIARDLDDKRTQSFYFQNNWFMSASDASDVVLIGSDDSGSSHGISYGWNGYAFDVKTSNWAWWNGRRPITAATFATDLSLIPYYGITGGYGKYEFLTASIASPNVFADHVDDHITVDTVVGTSVTLSLNNYWNVAIGDVIADGTGVYWVVTASDNLHFTIDRAGLATGNHRVGENCLRRVVWVGNDADDPMLDKSFIKATQPFERVRYGRNMTFVFSGYQNTTEYSTTTEYAPSGTEFAAEKPMIRLNHVPHEVGRDWALKAGFMQSEAGTYWATAGLRLLTRYTSDKVARG